jgi:hypothetical protein
MTFDNKMAYSVRPQVGEDPRGIDHLMDGEMSPVIDQLINPSWAEVQGALDRYSREAKRLRYWQWWFVGMFALYTTLVGILLLKLLAGQ